MSILNRIIAAGMSVLSALMAAAAVDNPQSVKDLLDRIGGTGTSDRIETTVDDGYKSATGAEMFQISTKNGKPWVKGTTLSAVTTGLGWYLNHTANVNLAWNCPTTTLGNLPLPQAPEEHTTSADYRYYLNYCTFSYSMSTWTWERWQQEIDWMALHGINMPLQIIGLEEVWRKMLMEDYGYSKAEANDFVGGPCFMAWFGMNNLEGWGGPNPDWWYERQAELGRKISGRMRDLGIEPVLPGFAGMVPSNFAKKTGIAASGQGNWCGFTRPYIVDSTGSGFASVAANYYKRLKEVMGESKYYSIDPYHEGGAAPANPGNGYKKMNEALHAAKPDGKWVIQSWQWSNAQRTCLDNIPVGELIVLDLYSDGKPNYNGYKGHETVYSTIFNFGGRTGFFGRVQKVIDGYFDARTVASVKGIGAAPEAIEQTPVMYDLLFELPWLSTKPDGAEWIAGYARRRYSADNENAREAWELLRTSALDCQTSLQGPHEAVMCGRPALNINKVSSWGGSEIFYDQNKTASAAYKLLRSGLSGNNFDYDLTDLVRQAVTDYSKSLLAELNSANATGDTERFNRLKEAFLELMLGVDELLCTHPDFMLGHWTERARAMADEVAETTEADRNWLELNNARTLITTWGPQAASESGGLRDYSYRQWGGMLKDFYYQRWKTWFDNGMKAPSGGWFQWEHNWATNASKRFPTEPTGNTVDVATRLLGRYLPELTSAKAGQEPTYVKAMTDNDLRGKWFDLCNPEGLYQPAITGDVAEIAIDFSRNGRYENDETVKGSSFAIPADAPIGERTCRITLADGTVVSYTLQIVVDITEPRTVSVHTADPAQGSVSIDGTDAPSVTTKEYVVVRATPKNIYDFSHWTDGAGNNLGGDNPLTYYGRESIDLTANFIVNKCGVPPTDGYQDKATVDSYKQYVKSMSLTQNGESTLLYETASVPDNQFIQIPMRIYAAPGGEFTLNWTDAGGLRYLFMSAYCDLNNDGKFEIDRNGELLGTLGKYQNNNNDDVAAGKFKVLLPYDTKKGTTHLRLRFDSSWNTQAWNAAAQCFAPDGTTNRLVYELLLDVVDSPKHSCTVTYRSNDPDMGSMRSENESMVYNPGETVIITAFPAAGCRVGRWVDNHGRELPSEWISADGNSVNFPVYDNAEITAEFERIPIEISGWQFEWEQITDNSIALTAIVSAGEEELDLNGANPKVGSVAPGLFAATQQLTRVILPADGLVADNSVKLCETKVTGDGTENKIYQTGTTIEGSKDYTMMIAGTNSGASFNAWGSAIWANGTNGLADDYSNGWSQFYISKDGYLTVKWDTNNSGQKTFGDVCLIGTFKIVAAYDASAKKLAVTASNGAGRSQSMTIANSSTMKDITRFATNVPAGIDFTVTFSRGGLTEQAPGAAFAGCRSLQGFAVPAGSKAYKAGDGPVVYDAKGRIAGIAEGAMPTFPFTLANSSGRLLGASPRISGGTMTDTGIAFGDQSDLNTLWTLRHSEESSALCHQNSETYANGSRLSADPAAATYTIDYSGQTPAITIRNGSTTVGSSKMQLGLPQTAIEITAPANVFALTAPHGSVRLPERLTAWRIVSISEKGAEMEEIGQYIAERMPVIITGAIPNETLLLTIDADAQPATQGTNLLHGTGIALTAPAPYYLLGTDNRFYLKEAATVIPANSAYIAGSDAPAGAGNSFPLDLTGSIGEVAGADGSGPMPMFDLLGRPATRRGIVVTADGRKILVN